LAQVEWSRLHRLMQHNCQSVSMGDPWHELLTHRNHLTSLLEAENRKTIQHSYKNCWQQCQICGCRDDAVFLQLSKGLLYARGRYAKDTDWNCKLQAMRIPHCSNCGTVTPKQEDGIIGCAKSLAYRYISDAPLTFTVTLQHCMCCGTDIASDAMACPHCGTTSPHGGFIEHPQFVTCSYCGTRVACDSGMCQSCGAIKFKQPSSCSDLGRRDFSKFACLSCGRHLAPDALFCVHCGISWPKNSHGSCELNEYHTVAEQQVLVRSYGWILDS